MSNEVSKAYYPNGVPTPGSNGMPDPQGVYRTYPNAPVLPRVEQHTGGSVNPKIDSAQTPSLFAPVDKIDSGKNPALIGDFKKIDSAQNPDLLAPIDRIDSGKNPSLIGDFSKLQREVKDSGSSIPPQLQNSGGSSKLIGY